MIRIPYSYFFNNWRVAVAVASSLCSGIDPGKVVYKQHEFCSHFLECLKK